MQATQTTNRVWGFIKILHISFCFYFIWIFWTLLRVCLIPRMKGCLYWLLPSKMAILLTVCMTWLRSIDGFSTNSRILLRRGRHWLATKLKLFQLLYFFMLRNWAFVIDRLGSLLSGEWDFLLATVTFPVMTFPMSLELVNCYLFKYV